MEVNEMTEFIICLEQDTEFPEDFIITIRNENLDTTQRIARICPDRVYLIANGFAKIVGQDEILFGTKNARKEK